jgi:hypothetical protein
MGIKTASFLFYLLCERVKNRQTDGLRHYCAALLLYYFSYYSDDTKQRNYFS